MIGNSFCELLVGNSAYRIPEGICGLQERMCAVSGPTSRQLECTPAPSLKVSHTPRSLHSNQSLSSLFSQIQWLAFSTASWIFMMTCLEILTDRPIEKSHFRSLFPTNPRQPTSTGLCSACHPAFSYILTIRGKYLESFRIFASSRLSSCGTVSSTKKIVFFSVHHRTISGFCSVVIIQFKI